MILFRLFVYLIERKSKYGPESYKTITIAVVKSYTNVDFRQFCLGNMLDLFTRYPKIPIAIFVEPLFSQIKFKENTN